MQNPLLDRLDGAVDRLLEKNRRLESSCQELQQEKLAWQQERQQLLADVEKIITRVDELQLEET